MSSTPPTPEKKDLFPLLPRRTLEELVFCGALALGAVLLWMAFFGRFDGESLGVPVFWGSDGMQHYMVARGILEGEGPWHLSRLAAPFGLNFEGYPLLGHIDLFFLGLLSPGASEPTTLVHLYWALSFALTAVVSGACFRKLGISSSGAFVLALLYAFLPYAFYRNVIHLSLVYWLVPLPATLAAALLGGTPLSRRAFAVLAGGCLLSGFTYAYTAFFAAFVLALALGLAALSRRGAVRPLALALLLTVGGTGLNLLPTLEAWEEEPGTRVTATSYKLPHHADLYGLRIRDLLTPVDAHPLPPLRHLAALVAGAAFPGSNENTSVRLGLVGSVGFLLLLGVSLLGTLRAPPGRILGGALQPLASLSLGCLLLGTVGGLGSLFNLLVIPDIRCYNRISVFVAFFALAAVGLVLDQFFRRLPEGFRRGALVLLLVCGLLDQRVEGLRGLIPTHREAYEALKATVREVEGSLPPETRIYQCPYYGPLFDPRWLRGGTVPPLLELGPYIVSEKLRWSAGALTARGVKWNEALAELSFDLLGDQLVAQGFGGLWVDRLLFEDDAMGARAVGAFEKTLGAPRISGEEGRFLLFDLAPRRRALEEAMGSRDLAELAQRPPERFRLRWGERATFEPGGLGGLFLQKGWGAPERFGRWTVARRGSLVLALPTPRTPRVRLRWEVAPFILPGQRELQRVTLAVGEEVVGRFALRSGGRHALETTFSANLLPAGNLELRFELPDALAPEAAGLASDWRELGLFSYALTLEQVP